MREMKNSGVEWIGEIPANWEVKKFKHVADIYTGNSIKDEEKSMYEDPNEAVPYIATKDIKSVFNTVDYGNGVYIKNDDLSFVRAYSGDTLMCIEGGSAGKKKARIDRTVCFVNKLCCFHATAINSDFLYYILNSPNYEEEFMFNITGLIGGVSKNKLMNFVLPFPSLPEQHRIADFLDKKFAKIDAVIEKQKQVIEKLKEYKLSVITEAVTCKVGWNRCKLGFLANFKNGLNYNGLSTDSEIKFLGVGDFKQHFVLNNIGMFSTLKFDGNMPDDLLLNNGDIIFVRSNGSKELVGRSIMVENINYPVTYSGFCIRMRNYRQDIVLNKFLLYRFRSNDFRQTLNRDSRGSNINNLNQELLSNLTVEFPSIEKQSSIVSYLDSKTDEIDSAIAKKQSIVEKLTEYKKSLIYEVVTGKREV